MKTVVLALTAVLGAGLLLPVVQAPDAQAKGKRACPTKDFVVGAGWGAARGKRSHAGIDLGGKRGTPLFAIEDGTVNRTKLQDNGAMQLVMDGKSGAQFYYGHMDEVLVEGGDKVKAGDVIALMGDTGSPGQVHLHFEFWRSGRDSDAVNPERLIERICDIEIDD